jgi:nucleoside 2-deoxyribosyltransferase
MKIFISFRYTGETAESLQQFFYPVRDALTARGFEVYLSLDDLETWDQNELALRDKFTKTFQALAESDCLFVVIKTTDRSEGMLMEVGYALGQRKPIALMVQADVQTYVREVANQVIEFQDHSDLLNKLDGLVW